MPFETLLFAMKNRDAAVERASRSKDHVGFWVEVFAQPSRHPRYGNASPYHVSVPYGAFGLLTVSS
jgi:hypothetical protein